MNTDFRKFATGILWLPDLERVRVFDSTRQIPIYAPETSQPHWRISAQLGGHIEPIPLDGRISWYVGMFAPPHACRIAASASGVPLRRPKGPGLAAEQAAGVALAFEGPSKGRAARGWLRGSFVAV